MRYLLILIVLSLSIGLRIKAQEDWSVVDNCMDELRYPIIQRGNWDFQGLIISSAHPEGVRAIRADRQLDYFIALEAEDAFPAAGQLSPDGRYFAYPIGSTTHNVNSGGDDILGVDYLRVVRTDGITDETYRFEASNYTYAGLSGSLNLEKAQWFGTEAVYYHSIGADPVLFSIPSNEITAWTNTIYPNSFQFVSPDGTRAFDENSFYDLEDDQRLDYPLPQNVLWFADSSAFVASTETSFTIVNRDGLLLEEIRLPESIVLFQQTSDIAIAPNQQAFAFWDMERNLFIADLQERFIYNLCLRQPMPFTYFFSHNLAWSPDSRYLAFSYDNYAVILDTSTFSNQVLSHQAKAIMAWVSLEGATVVQYTGAIRPAPLNTATPSNPPSSTPTASHSIPTTNPTSTLTPSPLVSTCQLEVLTGANLRSGAGANYERLGSAAVGFQLTADAQAFNQTEYFRWWHLTTGEWIREDFTREDANCEFLPTIDS